MKPIWITAQKGGAGQNTLNLHWAVKTGLQSKERIAVMDMDPKLTSVNWSTRTLGRAAGWPPLPCLSAMWCHQAALYNSV